MATEAEMMRCRKFGHPWADQDEDGKDYVVPDDWYIPPGAAFTVSVLCPRCETERNEAYTSWYRLLRRSYTYTDEYKALGDELKEDYQEDETRGVRDTRRYFMSRGLVVKPPKFRKATKKKAAAA